MVFPDNPATTITEKIMNSIRDYLVVGECKNFIYNRVYEIVHQKLTDEIDWQD